MLCLSLPQWQFEAHKMLLDYLDFRAQFKRMDLEGFIFARVYFLDACLHCTIVTFIWLCTSAWVKFTRAIHSLKFLCQHNPVAQVTDLACNVERHTEALFFIYIIVSSISLCRPFILLQRHMAVIRNVHVVQLECT